MRAWRKSNKSEHVASQRRAAAAGLPGNGAAPRGGGRSCRQRLRSRSELLGRPRGAALSARPLRNRLRSGVTQDGRHRHRRLPDAILMQLWEEWSTSLTPLARPCLFGAKWRSRDTCSFYPVPYGLLCECCIAHPSAYDGGAAPSDRVVLCFLDHHSRAVRFAR